MYGTDLEHESTFMVRTTGLCDHHFTSSPSLPSLMTLTPQTQPTQSHSPLQGPPCSLPYLPSLSPTEKKMMKMMSMSGPILWDLSLRYVTPHGKDTSLIGMWLSMVNASYHLPCPIKTASPLPLSPGYVGRVRERRQYSEEGAKEVSWQQTQPYTIWNNFRPIRSPLQIAILYVHVNYITCIICVTKTR